MTLTKKEIEKIFRSPIFSGVDPLHATEVFEKHGCRVADFEDGDLILSKNEGSHNAGIFLLGEAAATTVDESKNALLRFFGAGDFFGIANLFTNQKISKCGLTDIGTSGNSNHSGLSCHVRSPYV